MFEGSGTYYPSDFERVMAKANSGSYTGLLELAEMTNPRTMALSRLAARRAHGGNPLEVAERLFNTREGATYRRGASFLNNMLGGGSYVDLMAGYVNSAQYGGFGVSSFGRSSQSIYGPGIVANTIADQMFKSSGKFFSNATGTDNLVNTRGHDITTLSRIHQQLANTGRYANTNFATIQEASLAEKAQQVISNMAATGNTAAATRVQNAMGSSGGSEEKLRAALELMRGDSSISGDLRAELSAALDTRTMIKTNPAAMDKIQKDTKDGAEVLTKLKNIFGEVDDVVASLQGISGVDMRSANALDIVKSDLDRFNRNARQAGMSNNLAGFAQMNSGTFAALSQIYGSSSAAGLTSSDVTAKIIYQQRLNKASGGSQSEAEVANTVLKDVAGASSEQNMVEQRRLAYEASISGNANAKADAVTLAQNLSKELDPGKQAAMLAAFKKKYNISDTTNLNDQEITKQLGLDASGVGAATLRGQVDYSEQTIFRSIQDHIQKREGLSGNVKATYSKLYEQLGSQDMQKLFGNDPEAVKGILNDKSKMEALAAAGIDVNNLEQFIAQNKDPLAALNNVIAADAQGNAYAGQIGFKQREFERNKIAIDEAKYGAGNSNLSANQTLLQLGARMLVDNTKTATEKDVMAMKLMENVKNPMFGVNSETGTVTLTDAQKKKLIEQYGGSDPTRLKSILEKEGNFAEFSDYVKTQGGTIGVKDNAGTIISKQEMDDSIKSMNQRAKDAYMRRIGINPEDIDPATGQLKSKAANAILMKDLSLDWQGTYTRQGGAENIMENIVLGEGYENRPWEERQADAKKLRAALDNNNMGIDSDAAYENLGKEILTSDKYADVRKHLGIDNISEDSREELAGKVDLKTLGQYTLNKLGDTEYLGTDQEKNVMGALRNISQGGMGTSGGGGGFPQRIGFLQVDVMEIKKQNSE